MWVCPRSSSSSSVTTTTTTNVPVSPCEPWLSALRGQPILLFPVQTCCKRTTAVRLQWDCSDPGATWKFVSSRACWNRAWPFLHWVQGNGGREAGLSFEPISLIGRQDWNKKKKTRTARGGIQDPHKRPLDKICACAERGMRESAWLTLKLYNNNNDDDNKN